METYTADWVLDFVPINEEDRGWCGELTVGDQKVNVYNMLRWPLLSLAKAGEAAHKTKVFISDGKVQMKYGSVEVWKFDAAVQLWEAIFIHKMTDPVVTMHRTCVERAGSDPKQYLIPQPCFSFWPPKEEPAPDPATPRIIERTPLVERPLLIPPSDHWSGTVGLGLDCSQFQQYCETLDLSRSPNGKFASWRPKFIVLHNTGAPLLSQWHSVSGEQRMRNLTTYYRDQQKWSGGPHLFIADDMIWIFTPLQVPGVHSPSWNHLTWGVEIVGDYDTEAFEGPVLENTVSALASLSMLAQLNPHTLRFHKEDPRTTHKNCPGAHVAYRLVTDGVVAEIIRRNGNQEHLPPPSAGNA